MSRALTHFALVRPVWEAGGVRVEGPDEDAFTLAVAVLERLRASTPDGVPELRRVALVGEFPPDVEWALAESLGIDSLEVRRHPPGTASLFQAIAAASEDRTVGVVGEAVVAVDVASVPGRSSEPRAAAAAVGLLFGTGGGTRFIGQSSRHHPAERRPDATAWIGSARAAALGASAETSGVLALVAEAPPPVLVAEWRKAFPQIRPEVSPWELETWGLLPSVRGALALALPLRSASAGEMLLVAAIRRERTDFLAMAAQESPAWAGDWTMAGPALPAPNDRPFPPSAALGAVSEGAYVPRPRYIENLASRWRLLADRCSACGKTTFPVRGRCRSCGRSDALVNVALPRDGVEVEAVTTVSPGAQPTEFDPQVAASGAYSVVLVRLAEGVRATLQVADAVGGTVKVGDRVSTRLRRLYAMEGAWRYGLKAVPLATSSPPPP